jgi:hypothetical protein
VGERGATARRDQQTMARAIVYEHGGLPAGVFPFRGRDVRTGDVEDGGVVLLRAVLTADLHLPWGQGRRRWVMTDEGTKSNARACSSTGGQHAHLAPGVRQVRRIHRVRRPLVPHLTHGRGHGDARKSWYEIKPTVASAVRDGVQASVGLQQPTHKPSRKRKQGGTYLVNVAAGAERQRVADVLGALVRNAPVAAVERPLRVVRLDEVLTDQNNASQSLTDNHAAVTYRKTNLADLRPQHLQQVAGVAKDGEVAEDRVGFLVDVVVAQRPVTRHQQVENDGFLANAQANGQGSGAGRRTVAHLEKRVPAPVLDEVKVRPLFFAFAWSFFYRVHHGAGQEELRGRRSAGTAQCALQRRRQRQSGQHDAQRFGSSLDSGMMFRSVSLIAII